MANTNIMTGYTYLPVIAGFAWAIMSTCPVAKALSSPGVAMPLQIQYHAHKSITSSYMLTLPDHLLPYTPAFELKLLQVLYTKYHTGWDKYMVRLQREVSQ